MTCKKIRDIQNVVIQGRGKWQLEGQLAGLTLKTLRDDPIPEIADLRPPHLRLRRTDTPYPNSEQGDSARRRFEPARRRRSARITPLCTASDGRELRPLAVAWHALRRSARCQRLYLEPRAVSPHGYRTICPTAFCRLLIRRMLICRMHFADVSFCWRVFLPTCQKGEVLKVEMKFAVCRHAYLLTWKKSKC